MTTLDQQLALATPLATQVASSLEGPVDNSDIKAEEGALFKLGLLQGDGEGWLDVDDAGPNVGAAETLGDADGDVARRPSQRLGRQS